MLEYILSMENEMKKKQKNLLVCLYLFILCCLVVMWGRNIARATETCYTGAKSCDAMCDPFTGEIVQLTLAPKTSGDCPTRIAVANSCGAKYAWHLYTCSEWVGPADEARTSGDCTPP
jgi:hypothetical protein